MNERLISLCALLTWFLGGVVTQPLSHSRIGACEPLDFNLLGTTTVLSSFGLIPKLLLRDSNIETIVDTIYLPEVRIIQAHQICQSQGFLRNTVGSIGILIEYECLGIVCRSPDPAVTAVFTHHFALDCHHPDGYIVPLNGTHLPTNYAKGSWEEPFVGPVNVENRHFRILRNPLATFSTAMATNCGSCSVRENIFQGQSLDPATLCSGKVCVYE